MVPAYPVVLTLLAQRRYRVQDRVSNREFRPRGTGHGGAIRPEHRYLVRDIPEPLRLANRIETQQICALALGLRLAMFERRRRVVARLDELDQEFEQLQDEVIELMLKPEWDQ